MRGPPRPRRQVVATLGYPPPGEVVLKEPAAFLGLRRCVQRRPALPPPFLRHVEDRRQGREWLARWIQQRGGVWCVEGRVVNIEGAGLGCLLHPKRWGRGQVKTTSGEVLLAEEAACRGRTDDIFITNEVLCQLS